MTELCLHHVSVPVRDLEVSAAFYEDVFGLPRIERPPFNIPGVWFGVGDRQIHLVVNADGTYRASPNVNPIDVHFALQTDDFEGMARRLETAGFRADLPEGDPKRISISRDGAAGFPQLFVMDPDGNTIEVNGAAM